MEIYLAPPETDLRRVLTREQVLTALSGQGLEVATAETRPSNEKTRARWVLSFDQTKVRLEFQEAPDGLVFATLDQSMFDDSMVPDRICAALEALGWEVDQENVG